MDLTIVVVTSPTRANPALGQLPQVIDSFRCISGVDTCVGGVVIVADGYVVSNNTQTKRGRVSPRTAANYELYCDALCRKYAPPRYRVIRCPEHVGFAHAVKAGLENVATTFALVAQHDRAFIDSFDRLPELLDAMTQHEWVRYVGFPSVMNRQHANLLHCKYGLKELAAPASRIPLAAGPEGDANASDAEARGSCASQEAGACGGASGVKTRTTLMPLIFWYDSQHICHVGRYLRIFEAPTDMPAHLQDILGPDVISSMRMRRGDFIEDRFGQAQRKMMTADSIRQSAVRTKELFRYFGSYLLWEPQAYADELVGGRARVFVGHLRGRQQGTLLSSESDDGDALARSQTGRGVQRIHVHGCQGCIRANRGGEEEFAKVGGLLRDEMSLNGKGEFVVQGALSAGEACGVDAKEREWLAAIAEFMRAEGRGALRLTQIASRSCAPRPAGVKEKLARLVRRRGHDFGLVVTGSGCDITVGLSSTSETAREQISEGGAACQKDQCKH